MTKKEKMIAIANLLDGKPLTRHGMMGQLDLSHNDYSNCLDRLISIGLLIRSGELMSSEYRLTRRGHCAVLNKFKHKLFLYPNKHTIRDLGSGITRNDVNTNASNNNYILFNKVTKPRLPSWL